MPLPAVRALGQLFGICQNTQIERFAEIETRLLPEQVEVAPHLLDHSNLFGRQQYSYQPNDTNTEVLSSGPTNSLIHQ